MRTIVHLSDIHFGRVDDQVVAPLIRAVHDARPDLVAISGDFTQRARRGEFLAARRFLDALPLPRLVVPGNHDVPLYNVGARLVAPLAAYCRYISPDLEPFFIDDEIAVVGMNTARALITRGSGRLNESQVRRAAGRLATAGASAIRIVVTHHPFDLPDGFEQHHLVGRAVMAMAHMADSGADVFLAGHLHVSHVSHSVDRYQIAGHSALVVQAGTLSTRGRGELNTFNVLRVERPVITIERHSWRGEQRDFAVSWNGQFEHSAGGWIPRRA